jgi:hypothetical protein
MKSDSFYYDLIVYCGQDAPFVYDKMRYFSICAWTKKVLGLLSESLNFDCALRICEFAFVSSMRLKMGLVWRDHQDHHGHPHGPHEFLQSPLLSRRSYLCLEKMRKKYPNLKILKRKVGLF